MLEIVSDVFLSSILQSSYPPLLPVLYLHHYGSSLGDVPASGQSGDDDDNPQGDGNSSESGVGAPRLKIETFLALYCVA